MRYRVTRNALVIFHDGAMACVSLLLALYLRVGERLFDLAWDWWHEGVVVFASLALAATLYFRSYRHVWRFTSLNDLLLIAKAGTVAVVVFYVWLMGWRNPEVVPMSLPALHWMSLMLCLMAGRVLMRVTHDRGLQERLLGRVSVRSNVLIIGATQQAELFIREAQRRVDFPFRPVGILDNNARQHGREIHDVRVYGSTDVIESIVQKLARKGRPVQRLIIADPQLAAAAFAWAQTRPIPLSRLPSLGELRSGDQVHMIQPVAVEDILGRPQAALDRPAMRALVAGKRVMITGAGGTIGSELARQIVAFKPRELVLYELSEYQLYLIDQELATANTTSPHVPVLGDVRDQAQLQRVFAKYRPEIVFHAAAIKHVPLAEINPEQAVLTNVLGSKQVADACVAHDVATLVQISTDKAVNPLSVMGATKRVAEIYGQALAQDGAKTRFITVRFGNVLNSTGSVVPLFQKQIARGGPVTITHPDMLRYFMSISEAVQLVLQAAALGGTSVDHAPIFVLDMGEPMRIEELACQMIRLCGLRPREDIAITYTGLRPGEKLFEELFHDAENLLETSHRSIRLARARALDRLTVLATLRELIDAARRGETTLLRPLLMRMVPEYQPSDKAAA